VNIFVDSGPQSSPSQPSGTPSTSLATPVLASASNLSAMTKSTGSRICLPFSLAFFIRSGDQLGALFVEQRVADRHSREDFLEGEGHAATDDDLVGLVEQVVDQLDLVGDLGATEDRQQRPLRRFEHGREGRQLLVHQVAGRALGQLHAGHRRVVAVGGAKGIVDVDVGEPGQRSAEGLDIFRDGLDLGNRAVGALDRALAFFLDMEAQVFEQDDFAGLDLAQAASTSGPTQSARNRTGRPSRPASAVATGARLYCGMALPSGRPRWDMRMTAAPWSRAYLIVGKAASIRLVLVIAPVVLS
jgi:hypothetical protein